MKFNRQRALLGAFLAGLVFVGSSFASPRPGYSDEPSEGARQSRPFQGGKWAQLGGEPTERGQDGKRQKERRKMLQKRLHQIRSRVLREEVGLDASKQAQVEKVFQHFHDQRLVLAKEVRASERQLLELVEKGSDDQAEYQRLLTAIGQRKDALHQLRRGQDAELATILSPKERAKLSVAVDRVQRRMRASLRGRHGGSVQDSSQATDSK